LLAVEPPAWAREGVVWVQRPVKEVRRRASFPSAEVATLEVRLLEPTATPRAVAARLALHHRVAARSS
jgi:hypothetical protein